ncbi:MAG: ribosome-associated protein [Candidatus Endobugula sp.]|jgi:ribosome-associated protein
MTENVSRLAIDALDDLKGQDIVTLDVTGLSDVMDNLIVVTGTSNRHVKSLAGNVVDELKKKGIQPIGVEGMDSSDWVLVDYGTAVIHVMLPQTRQFYDLEKLWSPLEREDIDSSMPKS